MRYSCAVRNDRAADLKGKLDLQGKGSDIELENIAGEVTINGS